MGEPIAYSSDGGGRDRTCDLELRRLLLYPLSYAPRRAAYRRTTRAVRVRYSYWSLPTDRRGRPSAIAFAPTATPQRRFDPIEPPGVRVLRHRRGCRRDPVCTMYV